MRTVFLQRCAMGKTIKVLAIYTFIVLLGAFVLKDFSFFPTAVNLITALIMFGIVFYLMPGSFLVGKFDRKADDGLEKQLEKHRMRKRDMSWKEVGIALYVMVPWVIASFLFG